MTHIPLNFTFRTCQAFPPFEACADDPDVPGSRYLGCTYTSTVYTPHASTQKRHSERREALLEQQDICTVAKKKIERKETSWLTDLLLSLSLRSTRPCYSCCSFHPQSSQPLPVPQTKHRRQSINYPPALPSETGVRTPKRKRRRTRRRRIGLCQLVGSKNEQETLGGMATALMKPKSSPT